MEKKFGKVINFLKSNIGIVIVTSVAVIMSVFCVVASNFADVPINIETIEDFINIEKTGMDKHYVITGYLTFEDWKPIGDEDNPFTGTLEAKNPITIKSFANDSKGNVGLFAVNRGVILRIKVYSPSLKQDFNSVDSFGYFAGKNYGKITSCNVYMGSSEFNFDNSPKISVGMFCGINYGDVRKCVSTNQITVRSNGDIVFGGMCGSSYGGMVELCSNKSPTIIYSSNVTCGGLAGVCNSTTFSNNSVTNRINLFSENSLLVGGFIGSVEGAQKTNVANCYNASSITINNSFNNLVIGSVARDIENSCIITNSVVNMSIQSSSKNYSCGTFFPDDIHSVNNCYYIFVPVADDSFFQGEKAIYCELSLSKLGWDSAIWEVACSGIECIISYER